MTITSASRVVLFLAVTLAGFRAEARAETFVRWDQDDVPSASSLGISTLVIPAARPTAIRNALALGYRVYVEIESKEGGTASFPAGVAGAFVKGAGSADQIAPLTARFSAPGGIVRVVDERGKWPHIRTNWVTRNKDVLQVTGRSAQPWIENNGALIRIAASKGGIAPLLTYAWKPTTVSDADVGPRLENYLVAIAEAGSFGADLLLPLHERFERGLLLGRPEVRAEWAEIRRYIEFYSWNLPQRYQPVANIAVVASDALQSFELMNLLVRHNLPFRLVDPASSNAYEPGSADLVIVADAAQPAVVARAADFATGGGTVVMVRPVDAATPAPWRSQAGIKTRDRVTYPAGRGQVVEMTQPPADPDAFALEMRRLLGERRLVDIWNGITVITAPYADGTAGLLLSAMNYTAQPLPIQVRIRGTFTGVQFEAPEEPAKLLPFQHRSGATEFVLPALRAGGRVFLTRVP